MPTPVSCCLFFFLNLFEREREKEKGGVRGEGERERETQAGSISSVEPDTGLELTNCEIMI